MKRRFGLIGKKLDHSFSVSYFAEKFQKEGIRDASYEAFPLERIEDYPALLEDRPELMGLNVTIPYKASILSYLDRISPTARTIGAVNTVRLSHGMQEGFNTDVTGFEEDIHPILGEGKQAMILGTGGASKAVRYVLTGRGYDICQVSRSTQGEGRLTYEALTPDRIADQDLIVNCTPLGTWPDTEECPPIPYEGIKSGTVLYDLIYNPYRSKFLQKGEAEGAIVRNGYGMLVGQAEMAWRIWNEGNSN
ncbi:MAG: shikimate dehydrogenase [Flavobacteriales bacterium]